MSGFAHMGPLKPIAIPAAEWNRHTLLQWVEPGPNGFEWQMGVQGPNLTKAQASVLARVQFRKIDGTTHAIVPPRINYDWFVDEASDDEMAAPIFGRAHDIARIYRRPDEALLDRTLICAETIEGVRRYFELCDDVWVQVTLERWVTLRDGDEMYELSADRNDPNHDRIRARRDELFALPRHVHSILDPQWPAHLAADQVSRAEAIASIAHRGQRDRIGERSIGHVARVAHTFDPMSEPIEHAVGWLHDVAEDTGIRLRDLLDAGIRHEVVELVALLTRTSEVPQDEYYDRLRENPRAHAVKAAEIADNTAPWRTRLLDPDARERLVRKYEKARAYLQLN